LFALITVLVRNDTCSQNTQVQSSVTAMHTTTVQQNKLFIFTTETRSLATQNKLIKQICFVCMYDLLDW